MTVIRLSDYACHSDIVNGCVKYNITDKSGHLIAVMRDWEIQGGTNERIH